MMNELEDNVEDLYPPETEPKMMTIVPEVSESREQTQLTTKKDAPLHKRTKNKKKKNARRLPKKKPSKKQPALNDEQREFLNYFLEHNIQEIKGLQDLKDLDQLADMPESDQLALIEALGLQLQKPKRKNKKKKKGKKKKGKKGSKGKRGAKKVDFARDVQRGNG